MRKGPLSTPRAESRDERALKGGFHDVEEQVSDLFGIS
jgi:hypothetical protein